MTDDSEGWVATMRKILGGAMAATLVVALAAGCSKESDGDVFSQDRNDNDSNSNSDSSGDDAPLGGQGQAYADAIALVGQYDEPDDDSDIPLSEDASVCYGEAYVEIVGVERLAEKVTPEQIEEAPEKDAAEWGIEVSKEEGVEIFRSLVDCSPGVVEEIGGTMAAAMSEGDLSGAGLDADCLGSVDPADLEGLMGASIAHGDDYVPDEAEATAMVDWLMGCGDMTSLFIDSMANDASIPPRAVDCLSERLDDDLVREILITSMTAGDDADIEDSEAGTALVALVTECMTGG